MSRKFTEPVSDLPANLAPINCEPQQFGTFQKYYKQSDAKRNVKVDFNLQIPLVLLLAKPCHRRCNFPWNVLKRHLVFPHDNEPICCCR